MTECNYAITLTGTLCCACCGSPDPCDCGPQCLLNFDCGCTKCSTCVDCYYQALEPTNGDDYPF